MSSSLSIGCPGRAAMTSITVFIISTGLLGNSVVIHFVRRDLRSRKSPDKVLLLCISINNMLACNVSLPLHYLDVEFFGLLPLSLHTANALCFVKLYSLFTCLGVGYLTLAVLCYDRYEAITKFPQQRLLTYEIALRAILMIIAVVLVSTMATMSGFILDIKSENTLSEGIERRVGIKEGEATRSSDIALVVLTTVWITTANIVSLWNLFLVDRRLRKHIKSVRNTLGNQSTVKEVRMVHTAWFFVITYSCVWIPFGVSRTMKNIYPYSPSVNCYYITTYTLSYLTFSLIPFLYIIADKRIKNPFAGCCRAHRVAPTQSTNTASVVNPST